MVSFKIDPAHKPHIDKIISRIMVLGEYRDELDVRMDLIATHANGNPLDFERLADADDFNLMHDVYGIARHLNRDTGKLEDHFSPRFSARA